MKIKIDLSKTNQLFDDLEEMPDEVMKDAYNFYKNITPVRNGNAKRNTLYKNKKITSRYPYAGALDEGWSKQAPDGMSEPTIKQLDKIVEKYIERIS